MEKKLIPFTQWIGEVYGLSVQQFKKKPAEIKLSIGNHYSLYRELWGSEDGELEEKKHSEVN